MNLSGKSRTFLICLALAAATLAVYWPVCRHEFIIYDEYQYIVENTHVQGGLTWPGVVWAFTTGYASNWHPLTWLSHMLDVQMFGLKPGGHHLVSLLFHIANTLLLFLLFKRLTRTLWPSACVAALFALHPVHVESVAWAAERKDVLSTFFFFLTLLAYERYASGGPAPSRFRWWYVLALCFFGLGLMSKPMLVTTPFLLLLLDYWPLRRWGEDEPQRHRDTERNAGDGRGFGFRCRRSLCASVSPWLDWRPLILEKLPFFALAALSSLATFLVQKIGGAVAPLDMVPFTSRLANATMAYFYYVLKVLWPSRLALLYLAPARWPAWQLTLALLILAAITVLVLTQCRRRRYLFVGWFWFAGTLVPVIGLVQVGSQFMADRYTYIPAIGLFVMIVWTGWEWSKTLSETLSETSRPSSATLSKSPSRPTKFLTKLPTKLPTKFNSFNPFPRIPRILRFSPCLPLLLLGVLAFLAHRQVGFWRNSETVFNHCIAVTKNNFVAHNNLGAALGLQGRYEEAKAHVRQALAILPHDPEMNRNFGVLLCQQGDYEAAVPYLREAVRLKPALAAVYPKVAAIFESQGKIDLSIACDKEALRLEPDQPDLCNNLAWTLATCPEPKLRDGNEAVRLAEHACELSVYKKAIMVGTLAAAYAEAGRFPEAVSTAKRAIAMAEAKGEKRLAERNRQLLDLYTKGQAYHEPGKN